MRTPSKNLKDWPKGRLKELFEQGNDNLDNNCRSEYLIELSIVSKIVKKPFQKTDKDSFYTV